MSAYVRCISNSYTHKFNKREATNKSYLKSRSITNNCIKRRIYREQNCYKQITNSIINLHKNGNFLRTELSQTNNQLMKVKGETNSKNKTKKKNVTTTHSVTDIINHIHKWCIVWIQLLLLANVSQLIR